VLADHRAVLGLHQAVIVECRGRDLVCSTSSLFSSFATV
jgi:hypothetical protein